MEFDQFHIFKVTVCDNVLMQHLKTRKSRTVLIFK